MVISPQVELVALLIGIPLAIFAVAYYVHWSLKTSLARVQGRIQEVLQSACESPSTPEDPSVRIRFHLYTGCLIIVSQIPVNADLPASVARAALREFLYLNFANLKRYPGAAWVPLLTLIEYWGQIRSIKRQLNSTPVERSESPAKLE